MLFIPQAAYAANTHTHTVLHTMHYLSVYPLPVTHITYPVLYVSLSLQALVFGVMLPLHTTPNKKSLERPADCLWYRNTLHLKRFKYLSKYNYST